MKQTLLISVCAFACCLVIFSCASCCHGIGWWLGIKPPPLPQRVVVNKIGIKEVKLSSTSITNFHTSKITHNDPDPPDFYKSVFGVHHIWNYGTIFCFGNIYHIGIDYEPYQLLFVKDNSKGKIAKKISLPRTGWAFAAHVVRFGAEQYLVVVVRNRSRENSSELYVLDAQLNVVYEKHSLYAFETGVLNDNKLGDCVVVKIGNFHPPKQTGNEEYYVYYLPKK